MHVETLLEAAASAVSEQHSSALSQALAPLLGLALRQRCFVRGLFN